MSFSDWSPCSHHQKSPKDFDGHPIAERAPGSPNPGVKKEQNLGLALRIRAFKRIDCSKDWHTEKWLIYIKYMANGIC